MDRYARHNGPGYLAKVLVTGEVDYLARTCHFNEQPENLFGPDMVEGYGGSELGELILSCKPERQIMLETRSL